MQNVMKALKSRTVWTIIIMFLIGGTEAIGNFIPDNIETVLLGVLTAAAIHFKLRPSQQY